MKLRDARLCLDCDDVHQEATCPVCGSESFAFLSRWVPVPEGTRAPAPATSEQAEVFRELLTPQPQNRRLLKRGLLGLTALGLAGWAWRSSRAAANQPTDPPDEAA
jgi:hypothetical protein